MNAFGALEFPSRATQSARELSRATSENTCSQPPVPWGSPRWPRPARLEGWPVIVPIGTISEFAPIAAGLAQESL